MKNIITFIILLFASPSFAFELSFDTINAGVTQPLSNPNFVAGEFKTLYVNSGNDTIRFDSARVDLIKSENNQYEMRLIGGAIGDSCSTIFHFSNYGEYGGDFQDNINTFRFELEPGKTFLIQVEFFDYRVFGLIPEGSSGLRSINPPQPLQAKMTFFTSKGVDSITINGMQTNQSATSVISNRRLPIIGRATVGQTDYYTISGKRINLSSIKKATLSNGVGIAVEKSPDGSLSCRKSILTR